jgi:hypothetical protein
MKLDGSLSCSEEPTTGPYPEPNESCPDPILNYSFVYSYFNLKVFGKENECENILKRRQQAFPRIKFLLILS